MAQTPCLGKEEVWIQPLPKGQSCWDVPELCRLGLLGRVFYLDLGKKGGQFERLHSGRNCGVRENISVRGKRRSRFGF